jgi:hypothetical protein
MNSLHSQSARAWCNGCTRPFQGLSEGSIPSARLVLGQHGAKRSPSPGSPPTMTVGAHHDALLDFTEDARPVSVGESLPDVEQLVAEVVELVNHRVALAAVDTRVGPEIVDQIRSALEGEGPLAVFGLSHVPSAVRLVMLPVVIRAAGSAEVVALTPCASPPRELRGWLRFPTAAAPSQGGLWDRHRTYVCIDIGCLANCQPRYRLPHHGAWRSLVAHSAGGRKVAGSNPVAPIIQKLRRSAKKRELQALVRPPGGREPRRAPKDHERRAGWIRRISIGACGWVCPARNPMAGSKTRAAGAASPASVRSS